MAFKYRSQQEATTSLCSQQAFWFQQTMMFPLRSSSTTHPKFRKVHLCKGYRLGMQKHWRIEGIMVSHGDMAISSIRSKGLPENVRCRRAVS